ncbi:MAG: PPOX class F420-dependent oxidoreductase [Acidimicrobiales bacterium]
MPLDPDLKALASAKNFAALTTLGPDGMPSTHVMWVHADDDHVLINTEIHRQKFKNVARDARVAVTVWDADDAYRYVEARGKVTETIGGKAARDDIDALSQKYTGHDYANPIQSERVILQIQVQRVHKNGV